MRLRASRRDSPNSPTGAADEPTPTEQPADVGSSSTATPSLLSSRGLPAPPLDSPPSENQPTSAINSKTNREYFYTGVPPTGTRASFTQGLTAPLARREQGPRQGRDGSTRDSATETAENAAGLLDCGRGSRNVPRHALVQTPHHGSSARRTTPRSTSDPPKSGRSV